MIPPSRQRQIASLVFAWLLTTIAVGAGSWIFLTVLDAVTEFRIQHPAMIGLAPLVGLATGWCFYRLSPMSAHGSHMLATLLRKDPADRGYLARMPKALAPLIVLFSWLSHLAGLSVGREGTAIQMGAGIASTIGARLGLNRTRAERWLLAAGVAAGFGSVFGVPWAGAIFALEIGGWRLLRSFPLVDLILLCLIALAASTGADLVTRGLGVHHAQYPAFAAAFGDPRAWGSWVALGVLTGIYALLLCMILHYLKILWARAIRGDIWRPVVGGALFAPMALAPAGALRFTGLGTKEIALAFQQASAVTDPFFKTLITAYSLATGFRGGEVTPLFFVGATAGSGLANVFGLPPAALAGLGMVAVFGGAAGLPVTCAVMAGELFGASALLPALLVCVISATISRVYRIYDHRFDF